jgi:CRP-like cAMP-binding protein
MPPDERRPRRRTSKAPRAISPSDHLRTQMRERLEIGDYSGALAAAEEVAKSGDEDPEVRRVGEECRRVLVGMYESRIGSFHRAPVVVVSPHELIWRSLDATAGFILSRIDGTSTFEDIVDISGLPRFETCRILNQLLQDGIIR